MSYRDASALVPLPVEEPATTALLDSYRKDAEVLAFVCLDDRLAAAASREGFRV